MSENESSELEIATYLFLELLTLLTFPFGLFLLDSMSSGMLC